MKFAWIENNLIKDVAWTNPEDIYHPDVAVHYNTEVPDDAENGDGWVNGQLVKRQNLLLLQHHHLVKWNQDDFRRHMTLAEKTKWDNDSAPEIKTVKQELPKELAGATELAEFLVSANVISQETANKVLA
jgi:hypothetical protein